MNNLLDPLEKPASAFPIDGTDADKLEFLVRYGVLAPSKYNVQPWIFEICSNSMDVVCERHGALAVSDPENRQLIMSCGAALMNIRVAATYFGCETMVQPFPSHGNHYVVARLTLKTSASPEKSGSNPGPLNGQFPDSGIRNPGASNQDLFHALLARSTCRTKFRDAIPPGKVLEACRAAASRHGAWLYTTTYKWYHRKIAGLVARADREQMASKPFRHELATWMRGTGDREGISASAFGLPKNMNRFTPGLSLAVSLLDLGPLLAARDRKLANASPILAVLGTATDTPDAWLAAGQSLEAVLLQAAATGVSAAFLNQPVEINHLRKDLLRIIGGTGFPQVVLRMGYGTQGLRTPRRPIEEVVVNPFERKSNLKGNQI